MKPDFALDFRDNQIALLHRQEASWAIIGRVAVDDPDLDAALAYLRATALGLSPRGISTKLILPNEAILYTTLTDLPYDPGKRAAQIASDLTGRTPYAVEDLVWDWADNGASADVAVIARETLNEAESFANSHRFNPISFAAVPHTGHFDGEVWFGPSALSEKLLARGEVVERDDSFAYAAPPSLAAETELDANDFEMGDGALPAQTDLWQEPEPLEQVETPPDQNPPEPVLPVQDDAMSLEETKASDPQPQVWQDFLSDNDQEPRNEDLGDEPVPAAQLAPALGDIGGEAAIETDVQPASFDAAMADMRRQEDDELQQGAALDIFASNASEPAVPPIDAVPEKTTSPDGAEAAKTPQDDGFGEARATKAEQLLAAFAARRAEALAKAEAQTNGARPAAELTANSSPAALVLTDPKSVPVAPRTAGDTAPKLGSAQGDFGSGQDAAVPTRLKPIEVKHVPAKDLPRKPQNLKAMPMPKQPKTGALLAWALTGVLLLVLIAAAAMSSYMLESVNRLFFTDTALAAATSPEPAPQQTSGLAPLETAAKPQIGTQAEMPAPSPTAPVAQLASDLAPKAFPPALPAPKITTATRGVDLPPIASHAALAEAFSRAADANPNQSITLQANAPLPSTLDGAAPPQRAALDGGVDAAPDLDTPDAPVADPALAEVRPLPRPDASSPLAFPQAIGADPALAAARPLLRPEGILAAGRAARLATAPASLVAAAEIDAAETALLDPAAPPLGQSGPMSLSISPIPAARPSGIKAAYEAARDAQIIALAAANAAPAVETQPETEASAASDVNDTAQIEANEETELASLEGGAASRSVVAKQATLRNAIDLRDVNLIGIFGTSANRYALIRQSTGIYRKLKVGDRFDGGQVAAITQDEVRYAKGAQMLALQMPNM